MRTVRRRSLLVGALVLANVFGRALGARAADRVTECADAAERGQVQRDEQKLLEARSSFVACAQLDCPNVVRESCLEWLLDVERRTPSIVVSAKTAEGRDVAALRVLVDGVARPASIAFTALPLDPGVHTVRYEADGYASREEQVVLREGEARRIVATTLESVRPIDAAHRAKDRSISPYAYGLGGLSIAALGTFAVLAATGYAERGRLEGCSPRCDPSEVSALKTRFLVADVALVLGLVSLGGAFTVYFFSGAPDAK